MRCTPLVPLVLLLCLAPAASAAPWQGAARPPLAASLAVCGTGATEDQRFAVFTGSMPALRGTRRMAMQFTLWMRSPGDGVWRLVRAKGFGRWLRSDPGRGGFVYTKRVERLIQGASYRVVVRYRWFSARGVQRSRARTTPTCRQPDQRADLQVESVAVAAGPDAGTYRYSLQLRNAGLTAAGPFELGAAGLERDVVRAVAGLPAGERATVELVAPRCVDGADVTFTVDVRDAVEESDERDNGFRWRCVPPIPSSA